jgi:ATP-binding cassette subfamily C protein
LAGRLIATLVETSPRRVLTAAALTFGLGFVEGIGLLALVPLLELVGLDAHQGSLGPILAVFRSAFGAVGLEPSLPLVLGLYVTVVGIQAALQWQQGLLETALRENVVHSLRTRLYNAIQGTTWSHFSRMRGSSFAELLTQRVDRVANAIYYLLNLSVTGVIAVVYVAMAVRVSPGMSLLVLAAGAALGLTIRPRLAAARQAGERYNDASARLYEATAEHLESSKVARSYNATDGQRGLFSMLSSRLVDASVAATRTVTAMRAWMAVGSALLLACIVYVAHSVARMPPAALFLLIFLFARLLPRVTTLYEKAQALAGELPALEAVIQAEAQCLAATESRSRTREAVQLNHGIDCREVSFSYGVGAPALQRVTLSIAARKTTAIVGPSGAGKTTVADVLMGLLPPESGALMVDGVPLTTERLHVWRDQIGYVSQDAFLFHDTIRVNLLWAKPEATEDQLWRALALGAADDFVRRLPQGLDTIVGDRGMTLSGGERQRISLARALLRQPRLLILDEATSSLDSENETRIRRAIEQLHGQVTIVQITHRLSTIRHADVIHVLDEGHLVESGSWDELITRADGRLRALAQAQDLECPSPGPSPQFVMHRGTRSEVLTA